MEFEDSRNAFYIDPNAYICKPKKKENCKKIVFAEPYENVPNFYINNDFKKSEKCCCNSCAKPNSRLDNNNENKAKPQNFLSGLNLQNLTPILSMFGGGGVDLSKISGIVGNNQSGIMQLVTSFSNAKELPGFLNLFRNSNSKQTTIKKEIKSTDYEINSYTRVE